jgi:hypothetical protein
MVVPTPFAFVPIRHAMSSCMLLALLSFTMACPTSKPVAPVGDASDGAAKDGVTVSPSLNVQACARLRTCNCPESLPTDTGDSCETLFDRTATTKQFDLKPQCIVDALTCDAVRACGTVVCAVH